MVTSFFLTHKPTERAVNPMQQKRPPQPKNQRLETQIHRRKKAKAFSPLLPEWDRADQNAPAHLRMDESLMAPKSSPTAKK
ncbi:MAG TPA: hypothetical protein VIR79_07415 [Nitrospira sp.]